MNARKYIVLTLIGIGVGIGIGTTMELITSAINGTEYSPGVPAFLAQFGSENAGVAVERVLYGLYGAVCALAGLLYENERRPIALTSTLHFGIIAAFGLAIGAYLKWFTFGWEFVGFAVFFIGIYLAIWLVAYLLDRAKVKEMNAKLAQRK
ncbi:hypothetical protein J2S49_001015 [Arcanobacterium wilhelmae]|uniref:DUF3021 domain-containing protein n=1 Tax=Arcanobacterium wilhelmae TaxID=1803177 RepID=A0ABT9NB47_9ACTO|nr:DUF3021 domain-containing protein [Arcanobacterium wilhelmae]MDP9800939.1 hypothetical protein [Arcanobacterium wilhelmae]WFN90299.1 DUF3021 domain-containing protein [Arcanobacterium wilhelmae]